MDVLKNYSCTGQMSIFEYQALKSMTQCERVMHYIKEHGSISTYEAFNELGVSRLASRIHDLISDGIDIRKETVIEKNRFGEPVHFTRYSLREV